MSEKLCIMPKFTRKIPDFLSHTNHTDHADVCFLLNIKKLLLKLCNPLNLLEENIFRRVLSVADYHYYSIQLP